MIESNLLPEDGHCGECKCWGPPKELQPVTMWYRNDSREAMYRTQPDCSFRFDLICTFILFLSIGLIQVVVFKRWDVNYLNWDQFHVIKGAPSKNGELIFPSFFSVCFLNSNVVVIGSLSATTVALGLFLYLSNHQTSDLSSPGSNGPGQVIAANRSLRIAIFIISTTLIAACAIFSVVSMVCWHFWVFI